MHDTNPLPRFALPLLLVIAACVLCVPAALTPVSRTQEARVLLTGRGMVGAPLQRWLVPHTNGEIRLRKPPLAYWFSAGTYAAFGQSRLAGRLPAVAAAVATLWLTFCIGRHLFGAHVGFYATAVLLGSWLFFKQAFAAETDLYLTAFLTAGVWMALRYGGAMATGARRAAIIWMHGIGVMLALAMLAKGPPAFYLLIFLFLLDVTQGRLRHGLVRTFFTSGAVLTFTVIAAPWFVYALANAEGGQLLDDLENSAGGGQGHSGSAIRYIPMLLLAMAPWSILWGFSAAVASVLVAGQLGIPVTRPAALLRALRRRRLGRLIRRLARLRHPGPDEAGLLPLLCWGTAFFVPLLFWGNKQLHYLLPLAPSAAVGIAWLICRPHSAAVQWIGRVMLGLCLLAIPMIFVLVPRVRGHWSVIDMTVLVILLIAALATGWVVRRVGIYPALASAVIVLLTVLKGFWEDTLPMATHDSAAMEVRQQFPDASIYFRHEASLPFVLAIGRDVPAYEDDVLQSLRADSAVARHMLVIDHGEAPTPPPPEYRRVGTLQEGDDTWLLLAPPESIYARETLPASAPATAPASAHP